MQVFVTGGTGNIGSAVVAELLSAGHQVVGLARSDVAETALTAAGAGVVRGSLEDVDVLRGAVAQADGVIHMGFVHNFDDFAECGRVDRLAIEAMGEALVGSGRPFVVTYGVPGLGAGREVTEDDRIGGDPNVMPRFSEQVALPFVGRGVRVSIVRPGRSVHGPGDVHGFIPQVIGIARDQGVSAYVGDGAQRWPTVYQLDIARLYRLALEQGTAGSVYHGIAENVPFGEIAKAIGRRLGFPVTSIPAEQAVARMGFMGQMASLDAPASNVLTKQRLGWNPTGPSLLNDIDNLYLI